MPVCSPIAILDSGLGGLTVAGAIRAALPQENILYFGDTARVPYGAKTAATVSKFVRQIIDYLRPQEPKHVVIACNTATALALDDARKSFPGLSISGVIEPGAKAAVAAAGKKPSPLIGVIATEATVRSKAYEVAIGRRRTLARMVCRPTPLIVPLVEEGRGGDDPVVQLALKQYLLPMYQEGMDVLVLGCTHYPVYKDLIGRMLGPKVPVIDSADQCAQDVRRRLVDSSLLRTADAVAGTLRCYVTDDPPRFARLAQRFFGFPVPKPTWVSIEDLHDPSAGAPVQVRIHAPAAAVMRSAV
jgi:glutamate racemase